MLKENVTAKFAYKWDYIFSILSLLLYGLSRIHEIPIHKLCIAGFDKLEQQLRVCKSWVIKFFERLFKFGEMTCPI